MKPFQSFTMIRHPCDEVWATMRDRLPDVAAAMEDLQGIEVLERAVDADGLRVINRWSARQKVPAMLRGALGAEGIDWLDRALWRESQRVCEWTIEPSVLKGHIECGGKTRYESAMAGRGTRVTFEGYFNLRPGFVGMLPASLEPAIAGFVESVVTTMIPRNLIRAVAAAGDLIAAQRKGALSAPDAAVRGA